MHESKIRGVIEGLVPILRPKVNTHQNQPKIINKSIEIKKAKEKSFKRSAAKNGAAEMNGGGEKRKKSVRVGDAEAEAVGDVVGDVSGEVVERIRHHRRRRRLLAARDAGSKKEQQKQRRR